MVSMYYSLLLAVIGLPYAFAGPRYATFYDSADCDVEQKTSETIPIKMEDHSCIYEKGRKSFIPGEMDAGGGDYCFVYYKDDYCGCIAGSRLIHTVGTPYGVDCETKEVEGYTSYHFQLAVDGECPNAGCYPLHNITWAAKEQDSQFYLDPMYYDDEGNLW